MTPQQVLRSQKPKRKHELEAVPIVKLGSQPQQPPTKRQKQSYSPKNKTPPEFWDTLSRVPLCYRALQEFNRRAEADRPTPIAPQQRVEGNIEDDQVKQLQRFARRGGPDLRSIRGYSEPEIRVEMTRRSGSNRSSALDSNTKATTYSSKDPAFEQKLIDNRIYTLAHDDVEPDNLEEIEETLKQRRRSLSHSRFSRKKFRHFRQQNNEAMTEAEVTSHVIPIIIGKANILSGRNQQFNNLEPLGDHISLPQPDYFNGSRLTDIQPKVRNELNHYIIPTSSQHRLALPNFFMEVKGPDGKLPEATRQVTQDLAAGARGMFKMQSYGLEEPVFDNKAYTFASSYHSGNGTLQLFAMHPTKPKTANSRPEYHTTLIDAYCLIGNADTCRQGITAWRNLLDLAEGMRVETIASANKRANNEDEREVASVGPYLTSSTPTGQSTQNELFSAGSDDEESDTTSEDKLATPTPQAKRTHTSQQGQQAKRQRRISNMILDGDDE
ncbi:hypothetical protein EJ08DRAFT_621137 [Tothia fuscella]|uniref:DUF7924 domain-containing protein n=1 Tax=Tothia fuscella TaxID=1048955 RepID=A0A9P4TTG2_9PEZI|nr:hypothetical protein EJ08DRAFT_621137 [Tothia fuscella]